ncbi:unnamed protein product [Prorocentrum cordatum]|uniref:Potassium channel domain-containing protein n=1 Tax=Prorocentrum cordatum TaxID=2364126 RepID=A0ABN9YH47_9DINO|nr:unnamed protein product [Polarella glacialis]
MPLRRVLAAALVLAPGRCSAAAPRRAEGAAGPPRAGRAEGAGARRAAAGELLAVGQRSSHAVEAREGSPTHVTAAPDVQAEEFEKHQGVKRWDHLESSAGGNDKSTEWRAEKGGGAVPWLAAAFFIVLIGSMPVVGAVGSGGLTKTHVLESAFLYTWLLGGLYMFTNVLIFQSPHFQHPRPLCLEESVYLFAQILTTVGYGDITPARPRGQLCVGIFVFTAVLLISSMVQDMLGVFRTMMEASMDGADEGERSKSPRSEQHALKKAFEPVVYASIVFCFFAAGGTLFFTYYPGEEKTLAEAVYMSLITLSTVGFGAFTPSTHEWWLGPIGCYLAALL